MKNDLNLNKKKQPNKKMILGTALAIVGFAMIGTFSSTDDSKTIQNKPEETQLSKNEQLKPEEPKVEDTVIETPVIEETLPNYNISKIEDTTVGTCVRKTLHIVVNDDYSKEDLFKIAEKEINDYTMKNKVNALTVGFYESSNEIGNGYEMGRVEYVPNGVFADASTVTTGDYSTFKIVNFIEDKVNLPKGETLQTGITNVEQIKKDFKDIMDDITVNITLSNDVLKVVINEPTDHPLVKADENAIGSYTDWTLDNIKDDVKTLDILIKRPSSSVRAKLDMNKMSTDNGRYFNTNYIANCIVK